jgi:hypothetical protein
MDPVTSARSCTALNNTIKQRQKAFKFRIDCIA